jgi:hypothetical protein
VTVCTNDFALCNLVEHRLPIAIPDARGDTEDLVAEMVELEHARIGLAAVRARVRGEEIEQEPNPPVELGVLPPLGLGDVSGSIGQVVLAAVGSATRAAVVVALPLRTTSPGERS